MTVVFWNKKTVTKKSTRTLLATSLKNWRSYAANDLYKSPSTTYCAVVCAILPPPPFIIAYKLSYSIFFLIYKGSSFKVI